MKFFFTLLAFSSSFYGITQTFHSNNYKYLVTYELTYQPDSTDTQSRKSEEMFLFITDKFSRFSSAGTAIEDDIAISNNTQANYIHLRRQIPKTSFNYYLYKGLPPEKITYTTKIIKDKYRYSEDKNLFNWKIFDETDSISGVKVQKATTKFAGRNYTAWFAEKIPFSEGPYKFNGLPGLIVKIADEKEHYVFIMKGIQRIEQPISLTFKEEEFIETTQKELADLQEEYKKDPIGFAARALPGFNADYLTKSEKDRANKERKERLKKDNNSIELK